MSKRKEAYEILGRKGYLETKDLLQLGVENADHIELLIENEILRRLSDNKYVPRKLEGLFAYGKEKLSNRNFKEAFYIFELCYDLDPKFGGANLYKMYRCISNGKYLTALDYLKVLLDDETYKYDANLYLVLLHYSVILPDEYRQRSIAVRVEDTINDSNDEHKILIDNIKIAIFDSKLSYASELLNRLIKISDISLSTWILSTLLHRALMTKKKLYKTFADALSDFDWLHALNILKRLERCYGTNHREKMFINLLKDILEMETTQIPLMPTTPGKAILDEWILHRNYQTILKSRNIPLDEPFRYGSRNDIIQTVLYAENLRQSLIVRNERLLEAYMRSKESPDMKDQGQFDFKEVVPAVDNRNDCLTQMYRELKRKNTEAAFIYLEEFIEANVITEFTGLIKGLILLCTIYDETTFMEPMETIKKILEGEYTFDIDSYIAKLKASLSLHESEASTIYSSIITSALSCGLSERSMSDVQNEIAQFAQNSTVIPQNFILKPVTNKTEQ